MPAAKGSAGTPLGPINFSRMGWGRGGGGVAGLMDIKAYSAFKLSWN